MTKRPKYKTPTEAQRELDRLEGSMIGRDPRYSTCLPIAFKLVWMCLAGYAVALGIYWALLTFADFTFGG